MYLLLLITLVINFHLAVLEAASQVKCPNAYPNLHHTHQKREAPTTTTATTSTTLATSSNLEQLRQANVHNITRNQNSNPNLTIGSIETTALINSQPYGDESTSRQQVTLHELNNFRLEYNKYKILSHLSITKNVEEMAPEVTDDLRRELTSLTSRTQRDETRASSSRHRRSLGCDQIKGDKNACCLETFYVNFTHIGWDKWILYPPGYNANYCRGQCDLSHARYFHSTLLSKYSNMISLCCSPRQMAPLQLLYIDEDNKVHQKSIPDMIVEGCDCA